ncbi:MAG: hypothetical protein IJB83_01825 [Bacilli bacterium]|nr:hypothetical protein [Bacilli bacterium]
MNDKIKEDLKEFFGGPTILDVGGQKLTDEEMIEYLKHRKELINKQKEQISAEMKNNPKLFNVENKTEVIFHSPRK